MTFAQHLGELYRDREDMKRSLSPAADTPPFIHFIQADVVIRSIKYLLETRGIGDAFIIGHTTNAKLGTSELGEGTIGSWSEFASKDYEQKLTNVGRNEIRDWLASESATRPTHIGIGSSEVAYSIDQTTLAAEIAGERKSITSSSSEKENYFQGWWYSTDIVASGGFSAIREFGIFNDNASGDMYNRIPLATTYTKDYTTEFRYTETWKMTNVVPMMNAGIYDIRNWLAGDDSQYPTHIAWGSSNETVEVVDLILEHEYERNTISVRETAPFIARFEATLAASEGTGLNINRIGVFNAASGT